MYPQKCTHKSISTKVYLQEVLTHDNKAARISSTKTWHPQHPLSPASSISSIQYLRHPVSPASSIFGIQYPQHPGSQFQYPITGIQLQRPVSNIQSIQLLVSYQAFYPVSGFQYPATYRRLSQVLRCWESGECVIRRWNLRSSKTNLYTPSSLNPVTPWL